MLTWLKPPVFTDPYFGELRYERGMWRGRAARLGSGTAPLAICGTRRAPDRAALALARVMTRRRAVWRPVVECQLVLHLLPYAEAVAAGALPRPEEPLPTLSEPGDVWPHVAIEFVAVAPMGGRLTFEVGYSVAWAENHILSARFQDGQFVEMRGRAPLALAA